MIELVEMSLHTLFPIQENSSEVIVWYNTSNSCDQSVLHISCQEDIREKLKTHAGGEASTTLQDALLAHGFNSYGHGLSPVMFCPVECITPSAYEIHSADDNMELFHQILAQTFGYNQERIEQIAKTWDLATQQGYIENFFVSLDGQVVGTGSLYTHGSKGVIFRVGVLPQFQKCGVGRELMKFLMHTAYQRNMDELALISAPSAEGFYKKVGYTTICYAEFWYK